MKARLMIFIVFSLLFLVIDYYVFQAVLNVSKDLSPFWKNIVRYGYWVPTGISLLALLAWAVADPYKFGASLRSWMITGLAALYISKLFAVIVLFIDDLARAFKWVANYFYKGALGDMPGNTIPRSEFLSKTALVAASIPFGAMAYGIISGYVDSNRAGQPSDGCAICEARRRVGTHPTTTRARS